MVVADKAVHSLTYHPETLLNEFLEAAAYAHNLADRLHARADTAAHTGKFGQVPARNLADEIVELRGLVSRIWRTHLTYAVEGVSEGNLGSNKGKRIACSLGSKGGTA